MPGTRPGMGSEDFAHILKAVPGSYFFLGSASTEHSRLLHQSDYDFNDDLLPLGTCFWVTLTEDLLKSA